MEPATIGERIRQKRLASRLTQKALARKLKDVSHVAISQWESNTTKPNAQNLYELSVLFGCDFAWLLKGGEDSNVGFAAIDQSRIPVLTLEQLETWDEERPLNISIFEEASYIMTNIKISHDTFAVKIIGDAMEPVFFEGDIVVIDPELRPSPGEFVLSRSANGVVFRKYKSAYHTDGSEYFILLPLNENYADMSSMVGDLKIIGTMIEHRIFRRKR